MNNKEMITHPNKWPQIVLPLIKRNGIGFPDTALVLDYRENIALVSFGANLFDNPKNWPPIKEVDIDKLLAQGWIVD